MCRCIGENLQPGIPQCTNLWELTSLQTASRFLITFCVNRWLNFPPPRVDALEKHFYWLEHISHAFLDQSQTTHQSANLCRFARAGASRSAGRLSGRILRWQPQHCPARHLRRCLCVHGPRGPGRRRRACFLASSSSSVCPQTPALSPFWSGMKRCPSRIFHCRTDGRCFLVENEAETRASTQSLLWDTIYGDSLLTATTGGSTVAIP
jgi:hypothetical protein